MTGVEVDLFTFDRLAQSENHRDWEEAVSLYRGPVLEDWTDAWIKPHRMRRQRDYERMNRELSAENSPHREMPDHAARPVLPVSVTSFIGREKEIEEIQAFLSRRRLLTLTGAGGCEKSRLGIFKE